MKLYHYTKFDTFIYHILPEMRLRFSPISKLNDPFEFYILSKIDLNQFTINHYKEISIEYERQLKPYKRISFCKDRKPNSSIIDGSLLPTMWAHYGEDHNGICIELNLEKLDFKIFDKGTILKKSVKYTRKNSIGTINSHFPEKYENESIAKYLPRAVSESVEKWKTTSLFTKLPDWKIENEYRIVHKSENDSDTYLYINDAITSVYLGVRESTQMAKSIRLKVLEHLIDEKNQIRDKDQKIKIMIMETNMKNNEPMLDFMDWKDYQECSKNNRNREALQSVQS